jgi:outer membrane protein assembly factor BamB
MRKAIILSAIAAIALSGCGTFAAKKPKARTVGERVSVLNFEQQVAVEPELKDLAVILPPPAVNADWNQPGGSPAKTLGHLFLGDTLRQVWQVSIGRGSDGTRRLNATPVVADNRLFTMDVEATIRAFDATTGAPLWSARISRPGEDIRAAFGGGVSVLGDRVYASTGFGIVAAFNAATGAQVWKRQLPTPLRAAPSVAVDRVYVMSQDNQLQALDAATGEPQWEANATVELASILGPGAPAIAQDTVVAGFSSGELFALRIENGRTVWQDQLARTGRTTALAALADIAASPVIDRGRVFAIGHGGRMAALELATGQRVWERSFAGTSTPWVAGDFVFAVTVDGELVALTRGEGKIRWLTRLQRWRNAGKKSGAIQWFGPVLASDRLLLSSSDGRLVSVSPYTGAIISSIKAGAPAYLPPVVANKTLYLLTDDGKVSAYR